MTDEEDAEEEEDDDFFNPFLCSLAALLDDAAKDAVDDATDVYPSNEGKYCSWVNRLGLEDK